MQSIVKGFSGPGGTAAVQDGTPPFAAVALVMLSIVSASYSLAQSLVNPALQQLLVATTGLLSAGSVLAAVAPDLGVLLVGRAMQGAGGAILPLLLRRTVRPSSAERARGHLNWSAASFMAAALICLLLPLSLGVTWGWGSARALGLFAAAAVLGTAWVRIELRSETPLIDMRVMRLPAVWTANLASVLFGVGLYSAVGYLPSFLQAPPVPATGSAPRSPPPASSPFR